MTVITRFAPSPTGYLHIGGARTALFNWLFARHHNGKMLLRIEDTDRARSTDDAVTAIHEGLKWLGLDWDGEAISQFERLDRHREVVDQMLTAGHAYNCYCTPEELAEMRAQAKVEKKSWSYDGRWRDRDPADAPEGIKPVVRLKAPQTGSSEIHDLVQGSVRVPNQDLDDMILLRSDGTPTYMLAVVVDDHDMDITHVIRGDDHFTNAFRQLQIFQAMDWPVPKFAHIPLIHGPDGAKLSKRHGALGVDAYRDMGLLPEAMCNYLARLGWGHGDDEIFSTDQAINWFNLDAVGKAPARFDMAKLQSLNAHYMRALDADDLAAAVAPFLSRKLDRALNDGDMALLIRALPGLKERAKTLIELADGAGFYFSPRPLQYDDKAAKALGPEAAQVLRDVTPILSAMPDWTEENLDRVLRQFAEEQGLKFGKMAQPLRAALTGGGVSPGIFEVLAALGRDESLARIADGERHGFAQ